MDTIYEVERNLSRHELEEIIYIIQINRSKDELCLKIKCDIYYREDGKKIIGKKKVRWE